MNDTDASYFEEMFKLTLSMADGQSAPDGSILDLTFYSNTSCTKDSSVSVCIFT